MLYFKSRVIDSQFSLSLSRDCSAALLHPHSPPAATASSGACSRAWAPSVQWIRPCVKSTVHFAVGNRLPVPAIHRHTLLGFRPRQIHRRLLIRVSGRRASSTRLGGQPLPPRLLTTSALSPDSPSEGLQSAVVRQKPCSSPLLLVSSHLVIDEVIAERGLQSLKMSSSQAAGGSTWKCRRTLGPESCWASLPEDLIRMVALRLLDSDFLDYIRFRAVCTSWRSSTTSPSGRGVTDPRFHPHRWMLLPEGHYLYPGHPNLHGYVRFLNLDTGTLVCIQILLLGDHCAIDSVDGLLLLLRDSDQEGTVRLLHPFTGDITELPPLGTLLPQPQVDSCIPNGPTPYRIRRLARFVCASVSFKAGAMTIMLAFHVVWRVAYATSQDRQWTLSSWRCPMLYAPLSFQGKLYIVGTPRMWESMHQVFQIDPPGQDGAGADPQLQPPKLIATIPTGKLIHPDGLVQCGTEILVLGQNDLLVSQILVCKLADLVLQSFIPVDNIGDNTLFLGERNLSVSSKILPTVKGDNVVYKRSRRPYLAQNHLSSGSLTPAIDNCSLYGCAPGPSSLVHYIFSCCTSDLWNRGLLFRRARDADGWFV